MPATPIHILGSDGRLTSPYVCMMAPRADDSAAYAERCDQRFTVQWFPMREGGQPSSEPRWRLFGVEPPGGIHVIGTDQYGRDQFSRFLHGARLSLFAGLLACILAIGLATLMGVCSGYYGGALDAAIMWTSEVFVSLPWLFLLFGVRAILPLNLEPEAAFLAIVAVIGFVGWARPARMIRNVVLSAKEREYVLAARGLGASDWYLLRRHILPAAMGVILTQAALLAPRYILAEITLSFFGLGVNEPASSWGQLFASMVQNYMVAPYSAWMYPPIVSLIFTCYSYLTIAEFMRRKSSVYS